MQIPLGLAGCLQTRVLEAESLVDELSPWSTVGFKVEASKHWSDVQAAPRVQSPKSRSDRQLAHQNCLSDEQICCTRDAEEPRQHQLCYNYVCLSHPNLSGHFVVGFWSCLRNFYLRFIARKRPDDRFFGEKVRGERIFSVH